jgi:aspartyl protease family protein
MITATRRVSPIGDLDGDRASCFDPGMGDVRVHITVVNPVTAARSEKIVALADTGATLTVIPAGVLHGLGIRPVRQVFLALADGRRAARDVGDAVVAVDGDSTPCRVVFGEPDDAVLLGLTVLEQLGLAVDPVQRRLVPTDFLLY